MKQECLKVRVYTTNLVELTKDMTIKNKNIGYRVKLVGGVHNFSNYSGILTSEKSSILRSSPVKEDSVSNNNDRKMLFVEDQEVVEAQEEEGLLNLSLLSRVSDTEEKLVQDRPSKNIDLTHENINSLSWD